MAEPKCARWLLVCWSGGMPGEAGQPLECGSLQARWEVASASPLELP